MTGGLEGSAIPISCQPGGRVVACRHFIHSVENAMSHWQCEHKNCGLNDRIVILSNIQQLQICRSSRLCVTKSSSINFQIFGVIRYWYNLFILMLICWTLSMGVSAFSQAIPKFQTYINVPAGAIKLTMYIMYLFISLTGNFSVLCCPSLGIMWNTTDLLITVTS